MGWKCRGENDVLLFIHATLVAHREEIDGKAFAATKLFGNFVFLATSAAKTVSTIEYLL
jgi:hypothetical protein